MRNVCGSKHLQYIANAPLPNPLHPSGQMVKKPFVYGARPDFGERVLILKQKWLDKVLQGHKQLEIRGSRLGEGDCWLGCNGRIQGKARIGEAILINSLGDWATLRDKHLVPGDELPYKKTWGLPLFDICRFTDVRYQHRRGAIGIVKFRCV